MGEALPILYSFRRCPYAMRARMAILVSGEQVELREVVLRDKPQHMLEISPKGTVPVLLLPDGTVVEESLAVMRWVLDRRDPEGWLRADQGSLGDMLALVDACERDFKPHLDRYKYSTRYENIDPAQHREEAETFIARIEGLLRGNAFLFGERRTIADVAVAPFIRQFVNASPDWFPHSPYAHVRRWLAAFVEDDLFTAIMGKYPQWQSGDPARIFPAPTGLQS